MFKWIFGNQERKDLLLSFINSVLADGGDENIIMDIELKKWTDLSIKARNRLERWLLFLANNDPIELEAVALKDTTITKALEAEKKFLSVKQARYIYDLREKAKRDLFFSIATAKERGKKRVETKIAISMFKEGLSIEMIYKITKMDMNQLKQLQNKK